MRIRNKSSLIVILQFISFIVFSQTPSYNPIVEEYTNANRVRSGIAHGGLGTGSIELRKDGQFYNWSILNNWPLGTGDPLTIKSYPQTSDEDSYLFFIVRYQVEGEKPQLKLLQLNNNLSEGALQGITYYYPWMSAIDKIEYQGSYPFTKLKFTDPEMPFEIDLEVFSPFIPHDAKNSSLPGVYFNYTIKSKSDKSVDVFLIASLRNLVGYDTSEKYFHTTAFKDENYKGFSMTCRGMDTTQSSWGEMGLFSMSDASSYYLGWEHKHPYYEKLLVSKKFDDINDTKNRNKIIDGKNIGFINQNKDQRCFSSIGVNKRLENNEEFTHSFLFSWYFPNSYGAIKDDSANKHNNYNLDIKQTINQGHYYNNFFNSAFDVAEYMINQKPELTTKTKEFHSQYYNSSLPQPVLDQVNSQFNTFTSSSTFTKDKLFAIREGLSPSQPWGPNATIDVSLYASPAIIALFPELQKNMMRQHKNTQTKNGEINHGLSTDLTRSLNGTWGVYDRVDLVPNYIQIVLRDYFMTNDIDYLKEMWPSIKMGIEYILTKRDINGNMMPDMEGIMCSYDNFPMYGLSSYIQSQWIAAMASVTMAAEDMKDTETLKQAQKILKSGSNLMDTKLWNGKYYNLYNDYSGEKGIDNGVLTDQIIGQWIANQSNLGYLFNKNNIDTALQSVLNYSYTKEFGLRNCSWPEYSNLFPIETSDLWVDQANTCWSGVELAFASFLIYEGFVNDGEDLINTVNNRYRKAGLYWDHQEFGGHYYRSMSAWSILHAYLGLGINCGTYSFAPKLNTDNYTLLFSHGNGLSNFTYKNQSVEIKVLSGTMEVNSIDIENVYLLSKPKLYIDNKKINSVKIDNKGGIYTFKIPKILLVNAESVIVIK